MLLKYISADLKKLKGKVSIAGETYSMRLNARKIKMLVASKNINGLWNFQISDSWLPSVISDSGLGIHIKWKLGPSTGNYGMNWKSQMAI